MPDLPDLVAALDEIAAGLSAAGLPTQTARGKVQTPGAWLTPTTVDITTLAGGRTAGADLVLVVGDSGERNALVALARLLDTALEAGVVPVAPVDTSYALVLTGSPLPAFRVPLQFDY